MQNKKKPHALALSVLFALSDVIAAGCSCADNEYDGATTCDKLVAAANSVLSSCAAPTTVDELTVCGYGTGNCVSFSGCTPTADVDGCVAAIKALSCDDVNARTYATASSCVGVLSNIETACSGSSGDSD